MLILRNRAKSTGKKIPADLDESQISDDFKFHLFVSFQNKESSIALDLCIKLAQMNAKLGLDNFKLTVRLSNEKGAVDEESGVQFLKDRWNQGFIDDQVSAYAGQIKRIWVCGPPVMNEIFDRAFEAIVAEKG